MYAYTNFCIAQVFICPEGYLTLTCHTVPGETLLRWSLTLPGHSQSNSEIRFISSMGTTENAATTYTVGQTEFHFLRTSTSPLISKVMINNATTALNRTRIECSYGGSFVSTSIIYIIGKYRLHIKVQVSTWIYTTRSWGPRWYNKCRDRTKGHFCKQLVPLLWSNLLGQYVTLTYII